MQSVNIISYHIIVIDKQIVVAVATIPIFLAEACRHIAIVSWLTPKRSVITAKIKAASGKFLFVFSALRKRRIAVVPQYFQWWQVRYICRQCVCLL